MVSKNFKNFVALQSLRSGFAVIVCQYSAKKRNKPIAFRQTPSEPRAVYTRISSGINGSGLGVHTAKARLATLSERDSKRTEYTKRLEGGTPRVALCRRAESEAPKASAPKATQALVPRESTCETRLQ